MKNDAHENEAELEAREVLLNAKVGARVATSSSASAAIVAKQ